MKEFKVSDFLNAVSHINYVGDKNAIVTGVKQLTDESITKKDLIWCSDKYKAMLNEIASCTLICSPSVYEEYANRDWNFIVVENPRLAFAMVMKHFFDEGHGIEGVSDKARIHSSVIIGTNVRIGDHVIIEKDCSLGNNVVIDCNTVIKSKTIIGNDVYIGCNTTIGNYGFGYEKNAEGEYEKLIHVGGVKIMDNVEIGNNTCVDRAVIGYTILEKNVKVDNLVHIAHGVHIGENSLVIAHAIIGGSSKIGKNCWIAPNVSIMNKVVIGDNVTVGLGAVVLKSIDSNVTVVGNPARVLQK